MKKSNLVYLLPGHPGAEIVEDDARPEGHGFPCGEGHVGGEDGVFGVKERLVRGQWRLNVKDVDAGASKFAAV